MNTHCNTCDIFKDCHYPYKPTDCHNYRKFWDLIRREAHDNNEQNSVPKAVMKVVYKKE